MYSGVKYALLCYDALGSLPEKNLFQMSFFFQRGGGVISKTKFFKKWVVLFVFGIFLGKGSGGWGLPNSKLFKELFCLSLDIFQIGGGGVT